MHKNFRTRNFLSDSDGRRKVGPRLPSEAVDPEEEKAGVEPTQEVSRETGEFSQLPLSSRQSPRILRNTFDVTSEKIHYFLMARIFKEMEK